MIHVKAAALALAGLLLGASAASAVPAITETDLNFRSGPGPQYPVVGVIPGGTTVDVGVCTGSWCAVTYRGRRGYANRSYLAFNGGGPVYGTAEPELYYYEPYEYGYGPDYYYTYTPGFIVGGRFVHRGHRFRAGDHRFTPGGFERRGIAIQPGMISGGANIPQGGGRVGGPSVQPPSIGLGGGRGPVGGNAGPVLGQPGPGVSVAPAAGIPQGVQGSGAQPR
jgi:hypothetical protein